MSNKDDIYNQEYLQHKGLQEWRKFAMADASGHGGEVVFEVNWNSMVRKKGLIKISVNGETAVVSRDHLWGILFMLGSAEEQEKLVSPFMKKTQVTNFFKIIGVTAMKDIKKGELLNVPLEFTLSPETNQIKIGKGSMGVIRKHVLRNKTYGQS